jgi:hypothetical protein
MLLGACGPPDTGSGTQGPLGDGRLLIAWTIGGQPASATACAGIDHLTLALFADTYGEVDIEPVPCSLTKFRYDALPEGSGVVRLDAIDASGCYVGSGASYITVSPTLPASPDPTVAISAPGPCTH